MSRDSSAVSRPPPSDRQPTRAARAEHAPVRDRPGPAHPGGLPPGDPPATAFGATQRLFAGPAQAEQARGLKFVSSGATGFKILSIRDGVARVQLTGKLSSGGSTFTIANEIMPTLMQFRSVHWVKIYDQKGHTERPFGPSDSIPVQPGAVERR